MPVKASFAADFSDFTKAVHDAEVELTNLEVNASQAEKGIARVGTALSGQKLIQDAAYAAKAVEEIGGVTKLTAAEQDNLNAKLQEALAKYAALGQQVPPEIQAIADATKHEVDARTAANDAAKKNAAEAQKAATETKNAWQELSSEVNVQSILTNPVEAAASGFTTLTSAMTGTAGVMAGIVTGGVAVAGTLGFMAEHAASNAAALHDMSETTGMSVVALSKMSNAASVIGADMGTMTNALFQFEKRLAEPSSAFADAIGKMKFSVEDFKNANPDEYMQMVAEGFGRLESQSDKAQVAFALFGRAGRDMIATLDDLASGYAKTADIDPVTAEQSKQAKEFEETIASIKVHVEAWSNSIGRELIPALTLFAENLTTILGLANRLPVIGPMLDAVALAAKGVSSAFGFTATAIEVFEGKVQALPEVTGKASEGVKKFWDQFNVPPQVAGSAASIAAAFGEWDRSIGRLNADSAEHTKQLKAEQEAAEKWANVIDALQPILDSSLWDGTVEGMLKLGGSVKDVAAYFGMTEAQVKHTKDTMEATTAVMKLEADAVHGLSDSFVRLLAVHQSDVVMAKEVSDAYETNAKVVTDATAKMNDNIAKASGNRFEQQRRQVDDWVNNEEGKIDYSADNWVAAYNQIHLAAQVAYGKIATDEKAALDAMHAQEFQWAHELDDLITAFPKAMMNAFSGSGSISDSLGKLFGGSLSNIGSGLFSASGPLNQLGNSLTQGMTNVFGKSIGGAFGLALPGIGSMIGSLAQPLINWIGNLFSNPEKQINPVREAWIQAVGGLGALNQQAMAATGSLTLVQNLLAAKNADQYNAAITALNNAFKAHAQTVSTVQTTYASVVTKLSTLTSMSPELKAALDSAMNSKTADDFLKAIQNVGTEVDNQIAKQDHLNSLVSQYGLNWTEADKTFSQTKIDDMAKGLISDFTDLSGIFSNLNPVMEGMSSSVNDFIQKAQQAGVVVPAGMQRIIQTAIDAGTVIDKAGNKITDINQLGLTFGDETSSATDDVTKAMDTLGTKMEDLVDPFDTAIGKANDLAKAVANIPSDVSIRIHYDDPGLPKQTVPVADVPGFESGTGGQFIDFGRGSLAMLHGREAIVPMGQAGPSGDLNGLRQDIGELKNALLAEQRLAPERLTLALRGMLAVAR